MRDRPGARRLVMSFVLLAVFTWAGTSTLLQTFGLPVGGIWALVAVTAGLVVGGSLTALIARSWRRAGGWTVLQERTRAIRTGVLPAGADSSWLPGLQIRRRNASLFRWIFFVTALSAVINGLAAVRHPAPVSLLFWFGTAALELGYGAYWFRRGPRDAVVLDRFIHDLAPGGATPPTG